ncbi:MAG TPA: hypothetical protein VMQ65_10855 [Candidatus Limnocylindria bacterium]|nr:hypothetical protein [Candidatus Limnocylindria bacterium]
MSGRLAGFVAAASLQVVALVLAHELVFLARYGSLYGEALVHSGHGETWGGAVTTSVLLAAMLGVVAIGRLAYLAMQVRRRGRAAASTPAGTLEPRLLGRIWLRTGMRLAAVGVVLLTVQENIERASTGAPAPGAGILLTPEYTGGLWIAIAVGLGVGFVAALYEWRRGILLAKLRTARLRLPRTGATRAPRRPGITIALPAQSLLGRRSGLRAPPRGAAS